MVTPNRKLSNPRLALLNAAKAIMEEAGYSAVTSRQIAARADLKPQLVHYYFKSMDDLMLELFRMLASEMIELQSKAIASDYPLHKLWNVLASRKKRFLLEQFLIMSSFNQTLREEMGKFGTRFRGDQVRFMAAIIRENGLEQFPWSPVFLSIVFNSLARAMAVEPSYGLDLGNSEAMEVIHYYLDLLDKAVPDEATTIRRLELENAALRARIAELDAGKTSTE